MASLTINAEDAVGVTGIVKVVATLTDLNHVPVATASVGSVVIARSHTSYTAQDGSLTLDLEPNASIVPANTYWSVKVNDKTWLITKGAATEALTDVVEPDRQALEVVGSVPDGGAVDAILVKASTTDRDMDWQAPADLTDLPAAGTIASGNTILGVQSNTLVELDVDALATYAAAGGSIADNRLFGNISGASNPPVEVTGAQAGSIISVSDLVQPTTTVLSWANGLAFGDGTAGHGKVFLSVSALLNATFLAYASTADAQPAALLGATLGLRFGPGGASVVDWSLVRTGTALATLTGALTVTGATIVPDATAATHAMNRQTVDSRVGVPDGSTVQVSASVLSVKDNGVTLAKMAQVATGSFLGRSTAGTGNVEVLTVAGAKTLLAIVPGDVTGFDTQVRTSRVDQMAAASVDQTWTAGLTTGSGTAGHGKLLLSSSAILNSVFLAYANTADTQPGALLGATLGLKMGAGGSSATDTTISRTSANVITIDATSGVSITGSITLSDAKNIVVNTTTGTKIGTATGQKLGFWNATPVIQQASASQAAVAVTGATNTTPFGYTTSAQADAIVTLVNAIRLALVNTGIIKGAA